jgi:hypothetical protein
LTDHIVGAVNHLQEYFSEHGVDIPKDVNPAERMIDIVSGDMSKDRDWAKVWSESDLCKQQREELEKLKQTGSEVQDHREDDGDEYASSTVTQLKLVTKRASIQLWRDTEYVVNKASTVKRSMLVRTNELGHASYRFSFVQRFQFLDDWKLASRSAESNLYHLPIHLCCP